MMKQLIVDVETDKAEQVVTAIKKLKGVRQVKPKVLSPDEEAYWVRAEGRKPTKKEAEKRAKECDEADTVSMAYVRRKVLKK